MKKRLSELICFILCTVMTISLSFTALAADGVSSFAVTEEPEYYGRAALSSLSNSEALVYAYDRIAEGVEGVSTEIVIYRGTSPLSSSEINTVMDAYIRDYTQHFWIGNTWGWGYSKSKNYYAMYIQLTYIMTGNELSKARAEFDEAIDFMISGIDSNSSDFEKEKILHDRLAAEVTYIESDNAHNAYGAIVEGKAVCEGYAEAYQCLLRRVGIQSFIALGSSINPSTNSSEGHAWNYVLIDGEYYHVDTTWDDQESLIFYGYFNLADELIKEDHSINGTAYKLPECISDENNYFTVNGGKINSPYSVSGVAGALKSNGLFARLYITDNVNDFITWVKENFSAILNFAGADTAMYALLGREFIIIASRTASGAVSGNISSWDGTDNVTVKLYDGALSDEEIRADMKFGAPKKALANIPEATDLTVSGNKYTKTFNFKDLAAGDYKVAFYKPGGHVVDIKSVSVGDNSVTDINADMQKFGDINNDGNFNSLDLSGLHRALLNASEKTQACDANRSGTIDIIDLIRLKKIASSTV